MYLVEKLYQVLRKAFGQTIQPYTIPRVTSCCQSRLLCNACITDNAETHSMKQQGAPDIARKI